MSNVLVGQVYAQIISEVVEAAGVDFEEGGVDSAVLNELKAGWQQKLSQMNIASFPWDPKPAENNAQQPPAPPAPPTASQQSNINYTQATLSPPANASPVSHPQNIPNGPPAVAGPVVKMEPGLSETTIKQEPCLPAAAPVPAPAQQARPAFNAPQALGAPGSEAAQQRAIQHMQSKFGSRADSSINSLYGAKQTPSGAPSQQQTGQPQQPFNAQQYRQTMAANTAAALQHQMPHPNSSNGLPGSQVDGPAGGYEGVLLKDGVEMGRMEIDNLIHAQIASRAKQMEGGGLMVPLREATKVRSLANKKQSAQGPGRNDGVDDIKEEDDDALINSDLDDPDDDQEDDDDDDETGNPMMLCMYDKVQRVKNKWKCTLKDGVLLVNGREYIFHKATGEYEW